MLTKNSQILKNSAVKYLSSSSFRISMDHKMHGFFVGKKQNFKGVKNGKVMVIMIHFLDRKKIKIV